VTVNVTLDPPRRLTERRAVAEQDLLATHLDDTMLYKIPERPRDCVPPGADHLRDGVVGKPPCDLVSALFRRHGEQQARHPSIHVKQDQPPDLFIRTPEAPGQLAQEGHSHPR